MATKKDLKPFVVNASVVIDVFNYVVYAESEEDAKEVAFEKIHLTSRIDKDIQAGDYEYDTDCLKFWVLPEEDAIGDGYIDENGEVDTEQVKVIR